MTAPLSVPLPPKYLNNRYDNNNILSETVVGGSLSSPAKASFSRRTPTRARPVVLRGRSPVGGHGRPRRPRSDPGRRRPDEAWGSPCVLEAFRATTRCRPRKESSPQTPTLPTPLGSTPRTWRQPEPLRRERLTGGEGGRGEGRVGQGQEETTRRDEERHRGRRRLRRLKLSRAPGQTEAINLPRQKQSTQPAIGPARPGAGRGGGPARVLLPAPGAGR